MKRIKIILTLMLVLSTTLSAQSHQSSHGTQPSAFSPQPSDRMAKYREAIGLDYSMPDYSVKKIDANVMGPRLAKILESLCANYTQHRHLNSLSLIQSKQVEGLNYGRIKTMKLEDVTKTGNELTIRFNTILEPNNLNLKKSQLIFHFIDGVSEDTATNDFFCTLCRYIKE